MVDDEGWDAAADALYGLAAAFVRHAARDMSLTSVATLSTLDRTGARRITDLAAAQNVTQPSMTTLVGTLERTGLVERREHPSDGRVTLVSLTRKGRAYVQRRRTVGAETFRGLIDALTPDERAALAGAVPALERLREIDDALRDG